MSCPFFDLSTIEDAVTALKQGGIVAFPTETVYGLGADASNPMAIQKVFSLKQRPTNHPVIVHVDSPEKANNIAHNIPKAFWSLAEAFWPGPLTIILDKSEQVSPLVTGGHATVGIRVPQHQATLKLLESFDYGLIGPSANPFGRISPTCSNHVYDYFGEDIAGIVEGGHSQVGIESTVIYLQEDSIHFLRQGMISEKDIQAIVPQLNIVRNSKTASPGTHKKHYAPSKKMHVVSKEDLNHYNHHYKNLGLKVCGFGLSTCDITPWILMPNEPSAYAQQLYSVLHDLDKNDSDVILCERLANEERWLALKDRIDRAAVEIEEELSTL